MVHRCGRRPPMLWCEVPCRARKFKIVAVAFFCNGPFSSIFFLEFDSTLTANNSHTPKLPHFWKPHFFGVRWIWPNGIISPPYPKVTPDNFSCPLGGRLAAQRAVFWPPSRDLATFGDSHLRRESTLNFGLISKKLGQMVRVTKKMTWSRKKAIPGPNYGETADCSFGWKVKNGPKLRFLLYKHAQNGYSLLIIWEKGTFSLDNIARSWPEHG